MPARADRTDFLYGICSGHSQQDVRFILLFSFIEHERVQYLDYELFPKQCFNILSTG